MDTSSEHDLIGLILSDDTLIDELDIYLDTNDFNDPRSLNTIKWMKELAGQGKEVNLVSVSEIGNNDPDYIKYLAYCQKNAFGSFKAHALNVREKADKRRLLDAATKTLTIINDPHKPLQSLIDTCQELMLSAVEKKSDSMKCSKDQLSDFLNDLQHRAETKGYIGLETPWEQLTRNLGGMNKGELYTVAARPGMGKTNFALNLFSHAVKKNKSVLYISLEMTSDELMARLSADWASIPYGKFNRAELDDGDWVRLKSMMCSEYNKLKTYIDDSSTQTVSSIRAKARRVQKQDGLDLIIVDHVGLIDHGYENETQGLGKISRELKRLAKDVNCPVIMLSQLNRKCEERVNKRPMLSDLRQSGNIEQDSDAVIFIYRDEYYNPDSQQTGTAEVICAKVRKGRVGTIQLKTDFNHCRFLEGAKWEDNDKF